MNQVFLIKAISIEKMKQFFSRIPESIYLFLLSFSVAYTSFVNGLQGDTLFHIKIGEYVLKQGIPTTDPFSWTTFGKPWFAHEWLWDLMIAKLYGWFGFLGVFLLHFFSITLLTFVAFKLVRYKFLPFLLYLFLINTTLIRGFYSIRPQTFIYALFAFLLFLVDRREKVKPLLYRILLLVVFLLWANTHSSVILGLMIMGIFLIFRKVSWFDFFLTFFGSCLNPHGIKLFYFAFQLSNLSTTADRITEWFSPDFHSLPTLLLFLFILMSYAVTIFEGKKKKCIYLSSTLFFLTIALYLKSFRHLPFLLITSLVATINSRSIEKWMVSFLVLFLVVFSFIFIEPFRWSKINYFDFRKDFPVDAVAFMKKNQLTDRVLNEYHHGNYLMFEGIATFVDGRGDLFALENPILWEDYFSLYSLKTEEPEKILDKYKIKYILFPKQAICIKYLKKLPSITILYEDKKDVVLEYISGK